jgi:diguanylate cyclase (GGDEF)-like protein
MISQNGATDDPSIWAPSVAYLRLFIGIVLTGDLLFIASIVLFAPSQLIRAVGPMVLALITVVAWAQLRHGKVKVAVKTMTYGVWLVVTGIAVANGGLRTPIVYAYPVIILGVGLMISARAAFMTTAATALAILALMFGEMVNLLPNRGQAVPVMFAVVQISICLMAAALIGSVVKAYQTRLTELFALGKNLTTRTRHLEESKLQLQQAQTVAKVGSWVLALPTGEFTLSDETRRILDLPQDHGNALEAILQKTWHQDRDLVKQAARATRSGSSFDFEMRIVVGEATRWVRLKADVQKDADGAAQFVVGIAQDITERKAAEDQIQTLAYFDALTSLPNRRLLMDRLAHAMAASVRHPRKAALLFVDMDNFKVLNDTHGHFMGDQLLQQVAMRLTSCVREGDTVARLGGDEFVVMLEDLSEDLAVATGQARVVAEKVLAVLAQPHQLGNYTHMSTSSIGVTLFGDLHESIEEPLKRADMAMYQAKAAGRNTLRFFDPSMQRVIAERASLEQDLRDGLVLGQFSLVYQPQVSIGGKSYGAEALLRWLHPVRGQVSPAEFIPLAEDTGIILPLGQWVLESACTQLAIWADQPDMAHLSVAVNVSPRQFHQADFADQVLATLKRTGANPLRLKLELTEGMLVSNVEDVIAKMVRLKSAGVGFSLDDFGMGYSSLSYLKRLPLDQLKIDQSFVRDVLVDPNDAAISRMVIVLAESLGLSVVAEGVETVEQRDFLAGQGCRVYQGYLFSRPLPAAGLEQYVRSSQNTKP